MVFFFNQFKTFRFNASLHHENVGFLGITTFSLSCFLSSSYFMLTLFSPKKTLPFLTDMIASLPCQYYRVLYRYQSHSSIQCCSFESIPLLFFSTVIIAILSKRSSCAIAVHATVVGADNNDETVVYSISVGSFVIVIFRHFH